MAQRLKRLPAMWETWVRSLGQKIPWRRKWQATPVFLPAESHGRRSLEGYSPWGLKELDTTECPNTHKPNNYYTAWRLNGKESTCQCRRCEFDPWIGRIPWRRKWQPTPVFLPRKSHGQRSQANYSPWSHKELHTTQQLNTTVQGSSML